MNRDERIGLFIVAVLILLLFATYAFAHDPAHPELTPWYRSLQSGKGPCCDGGDAVHLADPDWESRDGHYRVRIPSLEFAPQSSDPVWVDVPDDAVVKVPNMDGRAMVWPMYNDAKPAVRCFMPGTMG